MQWVSELSLISVASCASNLFGIWQAVLFMTPRTHSISLLASFICPAVLIKLSSSIKQVKLDLCSLSLLPDFTHLKWEIRVGGKHSTCLSHSFTVCWMTKWKPLSFCAIANLSVRMVNRLFYFFHKNPLPTQICNIEEKLSQVTVVRRQVKATMTTVQVLVGTDEAQCRARIASNHCVPLPIWLKLSGKHFRFTFDQIQMGGKTKQIWMGWGWNFHVNICQLPSAMFLPTITVEFRPVVI